MTTFSLFALSELVCTKKVFFPILLFPTYSPQVDSLLEHSGQTEKILQPLLTKFFFFPLSTWSPIRRRNFTGLAKLWGGWPVELEWIVLISRNFSPQLDMWSCCCLQKVFLGRLPMLLKMFPKMGDVGELHPNAKNVRRPPPPDPPLHTMIHHVFIPLWCIWQCSHTGATLVHATVLPNFCLFFFT